ncbi:hypothetical protein AAG906_005911 [Vitis piasezkii]
MESSMCLSSAILSLCLSCMWLGVLPYISSAPTDTIKPGKSFNSQKNYWFLQRDFYSRILQPGIWQLFRNMWGDPIVLNYNQAARNSTATLLDSGNFVLEEFNSDGSVKEKLWESFDNPTDTLLPGMKLGINLKTGQNWSLASWINEQVPAPGTLLWNGMPHNWSFEFIPWLSFDTCNNIYCFNSVANENGIYFSYSVPDGVVSEWALNSRGRLSDTNRPLFVTDDVCDGFEEYPGCAVQNPPTCRTRKDGFVKQSVHISESASSIKEDSSLGPSDCQATCWNNCSCTACNTIYTNGTGYRFWGTKFTQAYAGDANQEALYVLSSSRVTDPISFTQFCSKPLTTKFINLYLRRNSWWIWVIIAGVVLVVLLLMEKMEEAMLHELATSNSFSDSKDVDHDGKRAHDLKLFSFDSIVAASNNFSSENKLERPDLARARNCSEETFKGSGQGLVEFKNEIRLIARLQHMNLVRLLGRCIKEKKRWIAQGLLYLHKYSRLRIIHRDLKASNILLDHDLNPKISDFGMARTFGRNASEANTNRIVGTYELNLLLWMQWLHAPEYAMEGIFSVKSDVYSFGVLLLEIVSGRKNKSFYHNDGALTINLAGYAWELWKEGTSLQLVDPMLEDFHSSTQMLRCIHIALLCVQESAADRPTMSTVISMLTNETVPLPNPNLPAFSVHHTVLELDSHKGGPQSCSGSVNISEMEVIHSHYLEGMGWTTPYVGIKQMIKAMFYAIRKEEYSRPPK